MLQHYLLILFAFLDMLTRYTLYTIKIYIIHYLHCNISMHQIYSICFSVMSPVENLVQIMLILMFMSLYSFLSILMPLNCTSLVCISKYCVSSFSSLKSRCSFIWLHPALELRQLCGPSTSGRAIYCKETVRRLIYHKEIHKARI